MDPDSSGRPAGGISPRASVTLWPLVTYLLVLDLTLGVSTAMVLLVVCGFLGAPTSVLVAAVLVGAVVGLASWLRTSIQFTDGHLVVTMLLRAHRIPWARVYGVTLQDIYDDSGDVARRRAEIRYLHDPGPSLAPVPARLGRYRTWARAQVRTVSLPLFFPAGTGQSPHLPQPRTQHTWLSRHTHRQREIIRKEFAARGYELSG